MNYICKLVGMDKCFIACSISADNTHFNLYRVKDDKPVRIGSYFYKIENVIYSNTEKLHVFKPTSTEAGYETYYHFSQLVPVENEFDLITAYYLESIK